MIIEAALNGGTPRAANPHVPQSTEELVRDGLACLRAGAAVVHSHLSERDVGPSRAAELYLAHFEPMLDAFPDALLYPTIVFNVDTIEERVGHLPLLAERCGLRIGLMEPGSGSLVPTGDDGLPLPRNTAYVNTPAEIRYMAQLCEKWGLGPSMVIFEPGFVRHALVYQRAGHLPRGVFMRLTLCGEASYRGPGHVDLLCGMPNTPRSLDVYLDMLADAPVSWAVSVVSGNVFENGVARHALERGGHLRVGLEDYAGPEQPTNLELVERAIEVAAEVGRPIASSAEAAVLLDLPERRAVSV